MSRRTVNWHIRAPPTDQWDVIIFVIFVTAAYRCQNKNDVIFSNSLLTGSVGVASDVSIVLGNNAFSHVYKIDMQTWLRTPIGPYGQANEKYIWYYAKGIGLIYYQKLSIGFVYGEWQLKNWQVN